MANPQAEDGFIRIAIELLDDAFPKLQLSGNEWRLLWVILRQTWGWNKKTEKISISYFERKTGLDRRHIHRALKSMVDRNIVAKNVTSRVATYGFQKDYTKWELLPKKTDDKNGNRSLPKMAMRSLPKMTPIIDNKDTLKKIDDQVSESFNSFYQAYPKHEGRKKAFDAWKKIYSGNGQLALILGALDNQKKYKEYLTNNKQFCPEWPLPASWINDRRWEDETPIFESQGSSDQTLISCPRCGERILKDDLLPDGRGCPACARSKSSEASE